MNRHGLPLQLKEGLVLWYPGNYEDVLQGMTSYYELNFNATDSISGINGSVSNATITTNRFGTSNTAYSFNGVNSGINLGNNHTSTSSVSINAWILTGATSGNLNIVSKGYETSNGQNFEFTLNASDKSLYFRTIGASGGRTYKTPTNSITIGSWQNVGVTCVAGSTQPLCITINGVEQTLSASDTTSSTFQMVSNTNSAFIGRLSDGSKFFSGTIDDVLIGVNYAATAKQHAAIYRNGLSAVVPSTLKQICLDASGNGNNGTLVNTPTKVRRQGYEGCLYNGSNTYVDFGNNASLQCAGSSITVSCVFRLTAGDANPGGGIGKGGYQYGGWEMLINSDQNIVWYVGGTQLYATHNLGYNKWIHGACTFDTVSKARKIYINGNLFTSDTYSTTISNTGYSGGIGKRFSGDAWNKYTNGIITNPMIWNRALSATEIQLLHKAFFIP